MYTHQTQILSLTVHAVLCFQVVSDNNRFELTQALCFVFVIPVISVYSKSII